MEGRKMEQNGNQSVQIGENHGTVHIHLNSTTALPISLCLHSFSKKKDFVGRKTELAQIKTKFKTQNTIFLHGIGGIGKSELAHQYIAIQKDFDTVIRVKYSHSLARDMNQVLNGFDYDIIKKYKVELETDEAIFEKVLLPKLFELVNPRVLLFIDNFDTNNDLHLPMILDGLPCKKIITTRYNYESRKPGCTININAERDIGNLKQLFYNNGPQKYRLERSIEIDNQVESLIKSLDGHTLAIKLLANQARELEIEMPEVVDRFIKAGYEGKYETPFYSDLSNEYKTAYGHILRIFDFSAIDGDKLEILKVLTYVPLSGIDKHKLREWCGFIGEDGIKDLNTLRNGYWIQQDETGIVSMHPVISEVLWRELKPSIGEGLLAKYHKKLIDNVDKYRRMIPSMLHFISVSLSKSLNWGYGISNKAYRQNYDEGKTYKEAVEFHLQRIWEKTKLSADAFIVFGMYNLRYNKESDSNTMGCLNRAMEIVCKVLNPDNLEMSIYYELQGELYFYAEEFEKALDCFRLIMNIHEQSLPNNMMDYMDNCNNMGRCYSRLKKYPEAYECFFRALKIKESEISSSTLDLVPIYMDLYGMAYSHKDYKNAFKYIELLLKGAEERIRANPSCDSVLISRFSEAADVCRKLNDLGNELKYELLVLNMYEQDFDNKKDVVCSILKYIGGLYCELGDYQIALEYYRRALDIQMQIAPENQEDITNYYDYICGCYYYLKDWKTALEYKQKVLEIQEKEQPPNRIKLNTTYHDMALCHYNLDDDENAISFCLKFESIKPRFFINMDYLSNVYNILIELFTKRGQKQEAGEYTQKLSEIKTRSEVEREKESQ